MALYIKKLQFGGQPTIIEPTNTPLEYNADDLLKLYQSELATLMSSPFLQQQVVSGRRRKRNRIEERNIERQILSDEIRNNALNIASAIRNNTLTRNDIGGYQIPGVTFADDSMRYALGALDKAFLRLNTSTPTEKKEEKIKYSPSLFTKAFNDMVYAGTYTNSQEDADMWHSFGDLKATILSEVLQNLKNKAESLDWDFKDSPYVDKTDYINALDTAINSLKDGWLNTDARYLVRAGIPNTTLNVLFGKKVDPKEAATTEFIEFLKSKGITSNDARYPYLMDSYKLNGSFTNESFLEALKDANWQVFAHQHYKGQNSHVLDTPPVNINVLNNPYIWYAYSDPNTVSSSDGTVGFFDPSLGELASTRSLIADSLYLNLVKRNYLTIAPVLETELDEKTHIKGIDVLCFTIEKAISANASGFLHKGGSQYYLMDSLDTNTGHCIVYDVSTHKFKDESINDVDSQILKNQLKEKYFNSNPLSTGSLHRYKEGGQLDNKIIKAFSGAELINILQRETGTGPYAPIEQAPTYTYDEAMKIATTEKYGSDTPENRKRLIAARKDAKTDDSSNSILRDIATWINTGSAAASFIPFVGNAIGAIGGVIGTGLDFAADAMDDSVSKDELWSNLAVNAALTGLMLIPGGGSGKIASNAIKWGKRAVYAGTIGHGFSLSVGNWDRMKELRKKEEEGTLTHEEKRELLYIYNTMANTLTMGRHMAIKAAPHVNTHLGSGAAKTTAFAGDPLGGIMSLFSDKAAVNFNNYLVAPHAVKVEGKWTFVDDSGNIIPVNEAQKTKINEVLKNGAKEKYTGEKLKTELEKAFKAGAEDPTKYESKKGPDKERVWALVDKDSNTEMIFGKEGKSFKVKVKVGDLVKEIDFGNHKDVKVLQDAYTKAANESKKSLIEALKTAASEDEKSKFEGEIDKVIEKLPEDKQKEIAIKAHSEGLEAAKTIFNSDDYTFKVEPGEIIQAEGMPDFSKAKNSTWIDRFKNRNQITFNEVHQPTLSIWNNPANLELVKNIRENGYHLGGLPNNWELAHGVPSHLRQSESVNKAVEQLKESIITDKENKSATADVLNEENKKNGLGDDSSKKLSKTISIEEWVKRNKEREKNQLPKKKEYISPETKIKGNIEYTEPENNLLIALRELKKPTKFVGLNLQSAEELLLRELQLAELEQNRPAKKLMLDLTTLSENPLVTLSKLKEPTHFLTAEQYENAGLSHKQRSLKKSKALAEQKRIDKEQQILYAEANANLTDKNLPFKERILELLFEREVLVKDSNKLSSWLNSLNTSELQQIIYNLNKRGVGEEFLQAKVGFKTGGKLNVLKDLRSNFISDNSLPSKELSKFNNGGIVKATSGTKAKKWVQDPNDVWDPLSNEEGKWYNELDDWNKNIYLQGYLPSLRTDNATILKKTGKHHQTGTLKGAWQANEAYTNTNNRHNVTSDIQNVFDDFHTNDNNISLELFVNKYNLIAQRIRDRWSHPNTVNTKDATLHNQDFKFMFKSRSGEGKNTWDLGYQQNLEHIQGTTTWMRRMDRYKDEFEKLLQDTNTNKEALTNRIHKIKIGIDQEGKNIYGYVYKKHNGDIGILDIDKYKDLIEDTPSITPAPNIPEPSVKPNNVSTLSKPNTEEEFVEDVDEQEEVTDDENQDWLYGEDLPFEKFDIEHSKTNWDDVGLKLTPFLIGAKRLGLHLWGNRKSTDLTISDEPVLLRPKVGHRYVFGDYDYLQNRIKQGADVMQLALRNKTTDANINNANLLQANNQKNLLEQDGVTGYNKLSRETGELALKEAKNIYDYNHDIFNKNIASLVADSNNDKYKRAAEVSGLVTNIDNALIDVQLNLMANYQLKLADQKAWDELTLEYAYNKALNDATSPLYNKWLLTGDYSDYLMYENAKRDFETRNKPVLLLQLSKSKHLKNNLEDYSTLFARQGSKVVRKVDSSKMRDRALELKELRKQVRDNIISNQHALDNLNKATLVGLKKMLNP